MQLVAPPAIPRISATVFLKTVEVGSELAVEDAPTLENQRVAGRNSPFTVEDGSEEARRPDDQYEPPRASPNSIENSIKSIPR